MCAIFGFISRDDSRPNLAALGRIVRGNEQRGSHAFGFAWIDRRGRIRAYRQTGRLTDHLAVLNLARDARAIVGHLRWATHGRPEQNINNHPHPADGGWIVHNGIVGNYDALLRRAGVLPTSDCDSEVIAQLIECSAATTLATRCSSAVRATTGPLAMLGLWARPAALVVVRRGNPLHVGGTREGYYLASLPDGLPGAAGAMRDDRLSQFGWRGGKVSVRRLDLPASRSQRSVSTCGTGGGVDRGSLFCRGG